MEKQSRAALKVLAQLFWRLAALHPALLNHP
jgi:hypothetical protein